VAAATAPVAAGRPAVTAALDHARGGAVRAHWVERLRRLVALPTVSGSLRHRADLEDAAQLLCGWLTAMGMDGAWIARAAPGKPPNVLARWDGAPGRPVVLLYAHVDVQPPGPDAAWPAGPFSAALADGRVHGRGASDDKGPLVAMLAALEAHLVTSGRLPVNVRVWFDAEEELGNPNLAAFLARHRQHLRCDGLVVCDNTRLTGAGRPNLVTGLRGMADLRLNVSGPPRALHSGVYGGEVADPALILACLLASVWSDGRITVPGFYDRVRVVGSAERSSQAAGPGSRLLAQLIGVPECRLFGEPGWAPGERSTLRPSVTVTQLATAAGRDRASAAVATAASARLNLRLVPDQRPDDVVRLLRRHLARRTPPGVTVRMDLLGSARPVLMSVMDPFIRAAARALTATWGVPPALARAGGTVRVVSEFHGRWGVPVAMWGLSTPGDAVHAAQESFPLPELWRGTEAVLRLLDEAAR
jgi:acetylornithine deacetylase/succinyl-diaminopimelate desuccinylase-like protein